MIKKTREMQKKEKTILIVDDVTENIDVLIGILGKLYRIRIATSGKDALAQVNREIPDLILLDIMMPGLSGFDVCKLLKDDPLTRDIPIVFVTALSDKSNEERGLQLGAVDYIYKPFSSDLVKVRVKNHLQLYMKRKELEDEVRQRTRTIDQIKDALIASLAFITETRDPDTGAHIFRTQRYFQLVACELLARSPGLFDPDEIDLMALSSSLHDIGKIGISDLVLMKRGGLSDEEYREIQNHPLIGGDVLRRTRDYLGPEAGKFLIYASEIAEFHHEHWDGSGYPHGLKGEEIPISARIMAIVDVYDALRSDRPYKGAVTHRETIDIITNGDGRTEPEHFDPRVLVAFLQVEKQLEEVSRFHPREGEMAGLFGR
jgi:putative two-component system response regulator